MIKENRSKDIRNKKNLRAWYFLFIFALLFLITIVYIIMNKIESTTTMLEIHVHRRNLSYIVDKDYKLEKTKKKSETVVFLNELTEFFYTFHENTVFYKKELDEFMDKRKEVLNRFNQSSINFYDLTVVPNSEISSYEFVPRPIENVGKYKKQLSKNLKQIAFSRILKFKKKDMLNMLGKSYFLCSARISISGETGTNFNIGFVSDQENVTSKSLMPYRLKTKKKIFSINRILEIKNSLRSKVVIKGYSERRFTINKVQAHCINFNDIEEMKKKKKKREFK